MPADPSCEPVQPKPSVPWRHRTTSPIGRCRVHQRSMLVLLRFPSYGTRPATELLPASQLPLPVPTCRYSYQSTNRTSLGERYPSASVEPYAGCPASSDHYRSTRSVAFRPKPCSTIAGTLAAQSSTNQCGPYQPCSWQCCF